VTEGEHRQAVSERVRAADWPGDGASSARPISVQAIVRVRLGPSIEGHAFEWWLQAIRPVLSAALLLAGDVDYELKLDCPSLTDLADVVARIRGCQGVEVASAALVLHEVEGLSGPDQPAADEVTLRRLREV
jgi:hypothetical protein